MTRKQAIDRLVSTRELTTTMLSPLGIAIDSFLQFAQLDDETRTILMDKLINHFKNRR
ncbi:hypothetical protein KAR91_60305 [Candidatus Pacearchaeota archaeon]|nr:hypothetical protein [Candidatus Pacearchaeota archaeon]